MRTLYPEQVASIRVLQIGSSLAVCPSGMYVLYLSTLCDDAIQGKKSLHAAVNAIFSVPISGTPENSNTDESENAEVKPTLLWSALYIQEMTTCSFDSIFSTPMPDGNLNYNDLLDATKKLFHMMFPHHEFFPETAFTDPEDDGGFDQSPTTRAWSQPVIKGTPPVPRDSHSCTTVADNLFVFGNTEGFAYLRHL
ncbi:unnamed protein product [Camellia sinensis]